MNGYRRYERFRLHRDRRVLTVTIEGTSPLNFIDGTLHRELSQIFADIAVDPLTDAVVLTSSGRCFCAGADVAWLRSMSDFDKDVAIAEGRKIIIDLLEVPQPIIAAINGPAIGLGATVALFCDMVIASETAVFADPHVVIGLVAGDGGAVIWPWLIGINRAKEYLLTGDRLPAAEALRLGLINAVVAPEDLLASAYERANRLAGSVSQRALRGTKAAVNKILRDHVNLVLDTSLAIERQCMSDEAHEAAMAAFMAQKN